MLKTLFLYNNNLSSLNLSKNIKLEKLDLRRNQRPLTVQFPLGMVPSDFKHDSDIKIEM
jgi:hypothetical protein